MKKILLEFTLECDNWRDFFKYIDSDEIKDILINSSQKKERITVLNILNRELSICI